MISRVAEGTWRREDDENSSFNGTQCLCRFGTQISDACILRGAKPDLRG